jgi:hypothetical protein
MSTPTVKALVARINRKLSSKGEALRRTRPGRARHDLGEYYLLDVNLNAVLARDVDPEALAAELGMQAEGGAA